MRAPILVVGLICAIFVTAMMVATPSATFEARDLVDVHVHGDDGPIIITAPQAGTNPRRRLTADSLLTCDFDNSTCGFDYTTDYNWTRRSGGTPTWLTGPTGDHTSGSGYYMYVEAGESPADGNYPSVGPFT